MNRLLSSILVVFILSTTIANAEGLLPSLTDTFGVDMPSMSVYLSRDPDKETTDESGAVKQVFYQVTENDFDSFNRYLEENGCALAGFSVSGDEVTENIEKQGKTFTFIYDNSTQISVLNYPAGTNPERYKSEYIEVESYSKNDQLGVFSFSPEEIQKYSIHRAYPEEMGVGEYISFGRYELDGDIQNGPEEIVWQIIDIKDGKALMLSKDAIDDLPFEDSNKSATWDICSLRRWLNDDFYHSAFNNYEMNCILETKINNSPNPKYGTFSGAQTNDFLFLLSADEVNQYLRIIAGPSNNWLRTTGATNQMCTFHAGINHAFGTVNNYGEDIHTLKKVRPALWLTLNNDVMKCVNHDFMHLTFGAYEQDNISNNGKEPIEWIVLEQENNNVLVVSRYALDTQMFNKERTCSWDSCFLRNWLNEYFLNQGFSDKEQERILLTAVTINEGDDVWTNKTVMDKIFLLSESEVQNYFSSDEDRSCSATLYGYANGADKYCTANCNWWLRSRSRNNDWRDTVTPQGNIETALSDFDYLAIRPAMWISLEE